MWSALAHQGDVYSASFAAVPHIVRLIATFPEQSSSGHFHFVSWIEICRRSKSVPVPSDLLNAYDEAFALLPKPICARAGRAWDRVYLLGALAALSIAKGDVKIAEAITELNDDVLAGFFEWVQSR